MENRDIELAGLIAYQTKFLLDNVTGKTVSDAEPFITEWVNMVQQMIVQFGLSDEVSLIKGQFDLSDEMLAVLCLTALPSIDSRYASFYTTFNGDSKSVLPKTTTLLDLVSTTFSDKSSLLSDLRNNCSLLYWDLLLKNEGRDFLESTLSPSKILINFLNDSYEYEDGFSGIYSLVEQIDLNLSFDQVTSVSGKKLLSIQGGFDERQLSYAFKIADFLGQELFQLNTKVLLITENPVVVLKNVLLAVTLKNGVIYWQNGMEVLKENPDFIPLINEWVKLKYAKVIYGQEHFISLPHTINANEVDVIKLVPLTRAMDQEVWESMAGNYIPVSEVDWKLINNTYYMYFPRLKQTFNLVKQMNNKGGVITTPVFQESYKKTSPQQITSLAYLDNIASSFDELVLEEEVQGKIDALKTAFSKRTFLNDERPTGVCAVFEGSTGSGKTVTAEALANELGLPLYRIDYALLADKTTDVENNLSAVFREAELNSAALLFDEADALFAKGATGGNSKSDLINGFLVQKVQDFSSLLLFTTNKKEKIAPSFFQKVTIQINFKALSPQQRYDVMKKVLKKYGVKVDEGVKLKDLASSFHLNGNDINRLMKNAVLSASSGKESIEEVVIKTEDLAKAIKLEES